MNTIGDRIIIGLLLLIAIAVVNMSQPSASVDTESTLIFTPWSSTGEVVSRVASAGARIVRLGAVPFIIVVQLPREGVPPHMSGLIATFHTKFGGCGKFKGASL